MIGVFVERHPKQDALRVYQKTQTVSIRFQTQSSALIIRLLIYTAEKNLCGNRYLGISLAFRIIADRKRVSERKGLSRCVFSISQDVRMLFFSCFRRDPNARLAQHHTISNLRRNCQSYHCSQRNAPSCRNKHRVNEVSRSLCNRYCTELLNLVLLRMRLDF